MTFEELQERCAELEVDRDRWREMAERLSKLVGVPMLPAVVEPYPFPREPVILPLPFVVPQPREPFRWPHDVVITCGSPD